MAKPDLARPFDRIILGQNQFFGVNHISDQKGMERERHFGDLSKIVKLLEAGLEQSVTALTITTHPRTPAILEAIRSDPKLRDRLAVYPSIPDPGKLMRMFAELGPMRTLQEMLGRGGVSRQMRMLFTGVGSFLSKDFLGLMRTLIDIELGPFSGLRTPGVFLSNNLNDLSLGLDLKDVFTTYFEHVYEKTGAVPAFNTINLPFHLRKMKEYGIPNVPVMAAINKTGFYVNPSVEAFTKAAVEHEARIVAMSTLASGRLQPEEAYRFLAEVPRIEAVTFGASTPEHLASSAGFVRQFLAPRWDGDSAGKGSGS